MVKHTQAMRLQQPTNCLSVFDHFVGLVLKGLKIPLFLKYLCHLRDVTSLLFKMFNFR